MKDKKLINNIKLFVLDMDGTFYLGDRIYDGSLDFLNKVKETGKEFVFLTNNSSRAPRDYVKKLKKMDCHVEEKDVLTSGDITIEHLKSNYNGASVYLLGTKELEKSFKEAGIILTQSQPDLVVVGFDMTLTYEKLEKACTYIAKGAKFIATHMDINCPVEDGYIPDCGAMCAAIELSTGIKPEFMGKPSAQTVAMITKITGYEAKDIAFVGDRIYTDVATGVNNGSTGVLVLTGETKLEDIDQSEIKPDFVFDSIKEMGNYLK